MQTISRSFTIDLRRLKVLRELEQRGTVAATAEALHITPSAVSQQLAGLAREIGVPLLEKYGRGVRLTGQARVLLSHAVIVQEQLERARADLVSWNEGGLGEVRIGSLSSGMAALVAPTYARMALERPGVAVRVHEAEPPDVFSMLDLGELDIVVTSDYPDGPSRHDPRYHRVELLTDPLDAVLAESHPLADPTGIRLADLSAEPWVGSSPGDPCNQILLAVCASAGFTPDIVHRGNEWGAVASLVAAGCGVALIPRLAQPFVTRGLAICPVVDAPAVRQIFAAVRSGAQADPVIMATLDALRRVAGDRGSG